MLKRKKVPNKKKNKKAKGGLEPKSKKEGSEHGSVTESDRWVMNSHL